MKFIITIVLLSIFVCLAVCQKPKVSRKKPKVSANKKEECKSVNKADTCMQQLLLLGDPNFVFPVTKPEMDNHCKTITKTEKCIKDYSTKCLDVFPRQVTSVLAFGVAKTNKGYCSSIKRKEKFMDLGKCGNTIKAGGDVCMQTYIDQLQGVENVKENNLKVPLICCNYFKLKKCIIDLTLNTCTSSQTTEIERVVDGYAHEVLNLICGDYTEESDKCDSVVDKTPAKSEGQKRPASLLPPFIAILGNIE